MLYVKFVIIVSLIWLPDIFVCVTVYVIFHHKVFTLYSVFIVSAHFYNVNFVNNYMKRMWLMCAAAGRE